VIALMKALIGTLTGQPAMQLGFLQARQRAASSCACSSLYPVVTCWKFFARCFAFCSGIACRGIFGRGALGAGAWSFFSCALGHANGRVQDAGRSMGMS
jgi:hypothetical protein